MTVSSTVSRIAYAGDGVTTGFAVPFAFFDPGDLHVVERTLSTGTEIVKTLNVDYTVSGGEGTTGTIVASTAPAASKQWIILRRTPLTQLIDYVSNDGFPAESHEAGLDRAAMRAQDIQEILSRTLRFPVGEAGLDPEMPMVAERAGKVLGFDESGNLTPILEIPQGSITTPVPVHQGGTGGDDPDDARQNLGFAAIGFPNQFTADQTIRSTDAGSNAGPSLILDRGSVSPSNNDVLGAVRFDGRDAGPNTEPYAQIQAEIAEAGAGNTAGRLNFLTRVANSLTSAMRLSSGLIVGSPSGTADQGHGWINVSGGYKVNGEPPPALAGSIVQRVHAAFSTRDTTTAQIPYDNTAPQKTEGKELGTLAIAPKNAGNRLLVTVHVPVGIGTAGDGCIVALFRNDEDSAVRAASYHFNASSFGPLGTLSFQYEMAAPNTSAITFRLRFGSTGTGTVAVNGGDTSGGKLGGTLGTTITIEELKA